MSGDNLIFKAGVGGALNAGAASINNERDRALKIRELEMRERMEMRRLAVAIQQLDVQIKENQAREARFNRRLEAEELKQTRDIRVRKWAVRNQHELALERQDRQWEHDLNLFEEQKKFQVKMEKVRQGPEWARIQMMRRAQTFKELEAIMAHAGEFVINGAMSDSGEVSTSSMDQRAAKAGFFNRDGTPDTRAYVHSLRGEWDDVAKSIFGDHYDDMPRISEEGWENLVHGTVRGDARRQKLFTDEFINKYFSQNAAVDFERSNDIITHAINGVSNLPMRFSPETGEIELVPGVGERVDSVISDMMKVHPSNPKSDMTPQQWVADFTRRFKAQTGYNIYPLSDKDKHRVNLEQEELAMFEVYFREHTGRSFPVRLSKVSDRVLDRVTGMIEGVGPMPNSVAARHAEIRGARLNSIKDSARTEIEGLRSTIIGSADSQDPVKLMTALTHASNQYKEFLVNADKIGARDEVADLTEEWMKLIDFAGETVASYSTAEPEE
jgi:hypothetical protein